jgi:hypothetical protein
VRRAGDRSRGFKIDPALAMSNIPTGWSRSLHSRF